MILYIKFSYSIKGNMTDFEESKNYDDLLSYRFQRFDIELSDFLFIKDSYF